MGLGVLRNEVCWCGYFFYDEQQQKAVCLRLMPEDLAVAKILGGIAAEQPLLLLCKYIIF